MKVLVSKTLIWVVVILLGNLGLWADDASDTFSANQRAFSYTFPSNSVVVELSYPGGMIANPDPTPFLRVYGDGRVHVHYPRYMKKAGDYSLMLSQQEMHQLILSLTRKNLVTFNAQKIQDEVIKTQRKVPPEYMPDPDRAPIVLKIDLDFYVPPWRTNVTARSVHQKISWSGLHEDVKGNPHVKPLQDLAAVIKELMDISQRSDLVNISALPSK